MQRSDWDRLSAPFPAQAVTWRIVELAPDGQSARVVPQLSADALIERLHEVAGPAGWALRYIPFGAGVGCELVVDAVARSAIADAVPDEGPRGCGHAALALAAELFGLLPPVGREEPCWVEYDPEERVALTPDVEAAEEKGSGRVAASLAGAEAAETVKPEGQQAIDRLVERLKVEGSGLEAARLLVEYGGYGSDPQAARELYGKLRELLARRAESSA